MHRFNQSQASYIPLYVNEGLYICISVRIVRQNTMLGPTQTQVWPKCISTSSPQSAEAPPVIIICQQCRTTDNDDDDEIYSFGPDEWSTMHHHQVWGRTPYHVPKHKFAIKSSAHSLGAIIAVRIDKAHYLWPKDQCVWSNG